MRRRRRMRLRRLILWGFLFVASTLAGALGFAYTYITDSATLAALIRDEAPRYLPTSRVLVDRVLLRPLVGDVEVKQATVWQDVDGSSVPTLRIPWLQVRSDLRSLIWGGAATREVVVARPELRLVRTASGSWNVQGLLADPFPQTRLPKPIVVINRGTVELADAGKTWTVLDELTMRIEPQPDGSYKFEGHARGKAFERLAVVGSYSFKTGRLELTRGDLSGLSLSDSLRARLPASWRAALDRLGLDRGEVDVSIGRLVRDPSAAVPLDYEVGLTLREGAWDCPSMPFPLAGVSATARVTPTAIVVDHAAGHDGKTVVRLGRSTLSAMDPEHGPMDLDVRVEHLDLDERLRARTPGSLAKLWEEFSPPGRKNLGTVDVAVKAKRAAPGGNLAYALDVDALDVALRYHLFPYPLEHVRGKLSWRGDRIDVDAETVVGGKRLTGQGTIDHPGPDAVVKMVFEAGAMPIDDTLLKALPEDARRVVEDFRPEGSVKGAAVLTRIPDPAGLDPKGKVRVDAELDLADGFSMQWKGLPYPVRNLSGHLGLHPDRWDFTDIKGENNLARIAAKGRVIQVRKNQFDVDLTLSADHLPFDRQLRQSLPPEWEKSWGVLNPVGSARVDARIRLAPGRPDDYKFTIRPEAGTRVHLRLTPAPGTKLASGGDVVELPPMDGVTGEFAYDNGLVTMSDVGFMFRQAPARFASGRVRLRDSGAFGLGVKGLTISGLRMEHELRKIMPPVMAEFARRLDSGKTFAARGDLEIGWSGAAREPASCSWENGLIVFHDNAVDAGLPVEHMQGEIRDLKGRFDGISLAVDGLVDLASVKIGGQHLTNLSAPIKVGDGRAEMPSVAADLLGGKLFGRVAVSLDATPRYEATLKLDGARLEEFAKTVPGRQEYKGDLAAKVEFSGLGGDLKTLSGRGEAHVSGGDLGKLPIVLEVVQPLASLARQGRSKFDAADALFTIDHGLATLDPVRLTSDPVSLEGRGTVGRLGDLALSFTLLPGREEKARLGGLRDLFREVEGQLLVIKVRGTAAHPDIKPEFVPTIAKGAGRVIRSLGDRKTERR